MRKKSDSKRKSTQPELPLPLTLGNKNYIRYCKRKDKALSLCQEVKKMIEEPRMKISELAAILYSKEPKPKPTILLNWDKEIHGMGRRQREKSKTWRNYSILDAISFQVIKKLKEKEIRLKGVVFLYHWLQRKFADPQVLIDFSLGKEMFIVYDFMDAHLSVLPQLKEEATIRIARLNKFREKEAVLIISLSSIMRELLTNQKLKDVYRTWLHIEIDTNNKVIYVINGRKIVLKDIPDPWFDE
jgi:hypothetical protein